MVRQALVSEESGRINDDFENNPGHVARRDRPGRYVISALQQHFPFTIGARSRSIHAVIKRLRAR